MIELKKIEEWVKSLTEHPVVPHRKRDERSFVSEKHAFPSCQRHVSSEELEETLYVCPHCSHHFRLTSWERIRYTADEGVFQEFGAEIKSMDPLHFPGYPDKLSSDIKKTGMNEAVVTGLCKIQGREVVLAVMDFRFIGGSMGSVVGEKIMRAMLVGAEKKIPVIVFAASGGARMQEGILSLMQMAKTSVATQALEHKKVPYFVVLTDPTTAGVLASFAMLGDVTIAEPGALMRFTGQRVVAGTIREKVPDKFPLSEFHRERGFVDLIVGRQEMKKTLSFLIETHRGRDRG